MGHLRGDCFDSVNGCGKSLEVDGVIRWLWVLGHPREKGSCGLEAWMHSSLPALDCDRDVTSSFQFPLPRLPAMLECNVEL